MLIDWLSLRLPVGGGQRRDLLETIRALMDRIERVNPEGELICVTYPPERLRSDTHAVTLGVTASYIYVSGSPCRVGQANNVFGSDDIVECRDRMLGFVARQLQAILPPGADWECTRIDATQNLFLESETAVMQALESLRRVQGGHFRVSSNSSTVYWQPKSDLIRAKAYAKGAHLRYQLKKGQAQCTREELDASAHLLRLELTFASRWIRRWREAGLKTKAGMRVPLRSIWDLTARQIQREFEAYWQRIVGTADEEGVMTEAKLLTKLREQHKPQSARAIYATWQLVKAVGDEQAKASMSKATWHRHKRALFAAGLNWADLGQRNVVAFRVRSITAQPVDTWAQLHQLRKAA